MFCLLKIVLKSQLKCKLQQGIETVDKNALSDEKQAGRHSKNTTLSNSLSAILHLRGERIIPAVHNREQTFNSSTTGQCRVGFHESLCNCWIVCKRLNVC
jgi:hypothetical protein